MVMTKLDIRRDIRTQLRTRGPAQRPQPPVHQVFRPLSPALRHWIMGRDGFQCRAPGCHQAEGLTVEAIEPGAPGGRNNPANLVTICSRCLPFWDIMGRGPFLEEKGEAGCLAVGL